MEITIRYATLDDIDSLALVYSQSYQAAFKGIIPDSFMEDVFSFEKRREGFKKEIPQGTPVNIIMLTDGKPVGILTYGKSKDEDLKDSAVEILRIYLVPEYWGQNLGMVLMAWGLEEMRQKGYRRISLWVIEDNKRARKHYERMGFTHDGVSRIINVGKEIRDLRYIKNFD